MIYLLKDSGWWWGSKSRIRDTRRDAEVSNEGGLQEGGDSSWKIESVPSMSARVRLLPFFLRFLILKQWYT